MGTVTRIVVDDEEFMLTADQDLVDLMERIEKAARTRPTFVAFSASVGMMSVLVCAGTRVKVTVEPQQDRDDLPLVPADPSLEWDY